MSDCDPRTGHYLDESAPEPTSLSELVAELTETDDPATTAALRIINAFGSDDLLARRIDKELSNRRHPLPSWIHQLAGAHAASPVWKLTDPELHSSDYIWAVDLDSDGQLCCLVHIDHAMSGIANDSDIANDSGIAKDAVMAAEPLTTFVVRVERSLTDVHTLGHTDFADARAHCERAIDAGVRAIPTLSTDTWPACRPLVEWMLQRLPAGGVVPVHQWRGDV